MDRNEVLANFQACTGIEDIGECMAILEQSEWNLQNAVTSSLAQDHLPSVSHNGARSSNRMLTFSCRLRETVKDITLDDSSTIGDLKQMASIELGISLAEMQFENWPPESAVASPHDETMLSTMQLPHFVTLDVAVQHPLPGVSVGVDENDEESLFLPCSAIPKGRESTSSIERLTRMYDICVSQEESYAKFTIKCEGSKTVEDLKGIVYHYSDIPPDQQELSGFPGGSRPDNDCTIASLNLYHPVHNLTLKRVNLSKYFPPPYQPLRGRDTNHISQSTSNGSTQVSNDVVMEVSSSDEEDPVDVLDDSIFVDKLPIRRAQSLMPERIDDVVSAQQQFQSEFASRYGDSPLFYQYDLPAAVSEAFGSDARHRKLLAVYLHHDGSIQSNVFCSQILSNQSIIDYLSSHYVTWAWDVTSDYNKERFLQMCSQFMGSSVADTVRRIRKDSFPVLVLAQGKGRSCEVNAIIQGNTGLNELMANLLKAVEDAEERKAQDIREEDARKARENIKREQEEAYEQSLAADRAKILAEQEVREQIEEEERQKKAAEDKLLEEIDRLKSLVPPEPDESSGQRISRVRFRAPDGSIVQRSFLASDSLQVLTNFVGSIGFPAGKFRILKSWPKVNISSVDPTTTLEQNKIYPQDSLIIEETSE